MKTAQDKLILGGHEFTSRFILGSGKFSLELVKACIEKADAQIITLALRRANEGGLANILDYIPENVTQSTHLLVQEPALSYRRFVAIFIYQLVGCHTIRHWCRIHIPV